MLKTTAGNGKSSTARVAVVAAGVVSPLGFGLSETLDSLREGRDCVVPVTRFSVAECRCKTAGQVADERLINDQPDAGRARRLHRASFMMIYALKEALTQEPRFKPELTVIGTTSGGMSYGEDYYRSLYRHGSLRDSPAWIANYPAQKPVIDAQEAFEISAPCQVIANACASGTNAIGHALECVRSGRYERVLAGGYDALSELVFVGFDSLQASTPEKCRPFDRDRTGSALRERAAILALANLEDACARGARVFAEVTGYGMSTDNFHLTQPNPSGIGPRGAMERARQSSQSSADSVEYINALGSAPAFNVFSQGEALGEACGTVQISLSM